MVSREYSSARRKSVELGKDILAMAKSPHIPSKFKKQSMDFGHMLLPGRRSRRPSTDAGPINIILESSVVEEKVPKVPVVRKEIALAKSIPTELKPLKLSERV